MYYVAQGDKYLRKADFQKAIDVLAEVKENSGLLPRTLWCVAEFREYLCCV